MKKHGIYHHLSLLSEPARVRLLRVLEREELGVGELTRIVQMPQSTVSRHLKALEQGGWVARRSEGTASLLRLGSELLDAEALELWRVIASAPEDAAAIEADLRRLDAVLAARRIDSKAFFGRIVGEWDALRSTLFGDRFLLPALTSLWACEAVVADLGCGTGALTEALAPACRALIAVDREQAMLDAAARRLDALDNVELRLGDLLDLPILDRELDVAVCALVLHHIEDPRRALAEIARALKPGGRALIVDMQEHDREVYRRTMGHHHLGFSRDTLDRVARSAGLRLAHHRALPHDPEAQGPALFAALLVNAHPDDLAGA